MSARRKGNGEREPQMNADERRCNVSVRDGALQSAFICVHLRLLVPFVVSALVSGCPNPSTRRSRPGDEDVPARANGTSEAGTGAASWDVPAGVTARAWRYVVIHHSGTSEGSAAAFDRYHKTVKGWRDLGYHFVIGNGRGTPDGSVEVSKRWKDQRPGAHAGVRYYNACGVGGCLVGNFERTVPTKKQMASLGRLIAFLMKRFKVPAEGVLRHRDLVSTKCPGKRFPWPVVGR